MSLANSRSTLSASLGWRGIMRIQALVDRHFVAMMIAHTVILFGLLSFVFAS